MAAKRNTRRRSGDKRRFYKRKTFWLAGFMFLVGLGVFGYLYVEDYTRPYRELAEKYDLELINEVEEHSSILDRNGKEIGRIFVQNRSVISLDKVPQLFIDTLRAGEDSRYWDHDGIDYIGVLRAVKMNWSAGKTTQGASTITQQLARNAYPLQQDTEARGESSMERKMVEAFLARRIEKRYSKKQILDFYLNRIYFGSGFYGIRSASLGYFGKEPMDLNLVECATIVGLIKNPTNNSPLNSLESSRKARDMVLERMLIEKMITKKEYEEAKSQDIVLNPRPLRRGTSHLYERIADAVGETMGADALAAGGFTIHTTISADIQEATEKALGESLRKAEQQPGYKQQKMGEYVRGDKQVDPTYVQGAALMVDHLTGEVLAHVGGRNYADAPFDFVEQGKRPLGTAFFPFLYATALSGIHTPASRVEDEPMDNRTVMLGGREGILGEWGMEIHSPKYDGMITIRRAFENSKIAATVRLATEVGLQKIVDSGAAFGFPMAEAEPLPRVSVGWEPVTLKQAVGAISTFAMGGRKGAQEYYLVTRIEDSEGRVVYRKSVPELPSGRLLESGVAWQVHSMMAGNMERGSAKGLKDKMLGNPFHGAGKGGTTHDFADAWFLGYNGRVSCGVWTGFLQGNNEPIYPGAFSRDLAMPVWMAAMNSAEPAFGDKEIVVPEDVVELEICFTTGQRLTQFCQEIEESDADRVRSVSTGMLEYFRKGQEGIPFCALHSGSQGDDAHLGHVLGSLPALDVLPVTPKAAVLIGDDPYHTELPSYAASDGGARGFVRRSTNVLDSFDLGEVEEPFKLRKPSRLEIEPE
jgi:membrane peptidoglycan carboxypeptidase